MEIPCINKVILSYLISYDIVRRNSVLVAHGSLSVKINLVWVLRHSIEISLNVFRCKMYRYSCACSRKKISSRKWTSHFLFFFWGGGVGGGNWHHSTSVASKLSSY